MNTAVNAVTTMQAKDSFKQSKSGTSSSAGFCGVYVAILSGPSSSLGIAVIHRVTVAHGTLSLHVQCWLRHLSEVTAVHLLASDVALPASLASVNDPALRKT